MIHKNVQVIVLTQVGNALLEKRANVNTPPQKVIHAMKN